MEQFVLVPVLKIWVDKGTESAADFKKLCRAKKIQTCFIMSETKTAFAERTVRSLRSILYRYMEQYGYKYIHKLSQLVTTLESGKNCSIDLITNIFKIFTSDPFFAASHCETIENPSLNLEKDFACRSKRLTLHEGLQTTVYTGCFRNCKGFFEKCSNLDNKRRTRWDFPW